MPIALRLFGETLPTVATPLLREHRLYQADWLLRFYGFRLDEVQSATDGGMLDQAIKHRPGMLPS